ncbi:MAG: efflux RND transporter periplasmic adaptor subunit, partial [Gemmatimonadetes bacterium]|nr:efflux RND transporter periplasmic adaptor subunit [Gemmatimonadota bacterium]
DLAFLSLEDDPAVVLRARYGGAEREWKGTIVRKEAEVDPVTRMVTVVARVGRQENELPFGLFVDAEIEGRDLAGAAVLPRAAMRGDDRVYVIEEETLRFREVQVARRERDRVVVRSGLAAGDLVILSRLTAATDGMKVRTADRAGGDV